MAPSRRRFLGAAAATVAAGWLGRPPRLDAGQQTAGPAAPAPVEPVFTPVRRNVGFFTARGGTIGYLIAPAGIAVVDAQFPDTAALYLAGQRERSGPRPVDVLLNTHHHADHTGGNIVFKGVARRVVAHATAADHMRHPPGRPAPTGDQLFPTETFTETFRTLVGDEVIRAKFFGPAHTSGDVVVTFERANVAHMGDLVFNRRHPAVDRPAGASLRHWIAVVEQAVAEHPADTIYVFGHAGGTFPVSGRRADLVLMRDYVTALLEYVDKARRGKPRDRVIASTDVLPGFEAHGPLNPAILGAAFDELTAA